MTFLPSSLRQPSALPGFGLALGFTLAALSLIVLIPLAALVLHAASIGPADFFKTASDPRTLAALRLSFGTALIAALINTVFGLLIAWVLVRYRFPGRRIIDAAVDLPFALPTAVAGIAMAAIYAPNGPIGSIAQSFGLKIAYTPLGIVVALVFIGLPFVVRTVQPVLLELDRETEEAAASLGATNPVIFVRVILPALLPALLTGAGLAFSRAIGEFGSVVLIGGAIPGETEVSSQWIRTLIENDDRTGAAAISIVLLVVSFVVLFVLRVVGSRAAKREGLAA